jgi:DNA-binding winged helix-turn-helix (wHTH) protein
MPSAAQWLFGPFRLDVADACLWRGDAMLSLRPKPFAVLAYLVAHAGQLVTKEALFEAIWPDTVVSDAVLKAHLRQIRQVLDDTAQTPQFIATVHRRGYQFIAPVTASDEPAVAPLPTTRRRKRRRCGLIDSDDPSPTVTAARWPAMASSSASPRRWCV